MWHLECFPCSRPYFQPCPPSAAPPWLYCPCVEGAARAQEEAGVGLARTQAALAGECAQHLEYRQMQVRAAAAGLRGRTCCVRLQVLPSCFGFGYGFLPLDHGWQRSGSRTLHGGLLVDQQRQPEVERVCASASERQPQPPPPFLCAIRAGCRFRSGPRAAVRHLHWKTDACFRSRDPCACKTGTAQALTSPVPTVLLLQPGRVEAALGARTPMHDSQSCIPRH